MPSERKKKTRTRKIELRTTTTACNSIESDAECPNVDLHTKALIVIVLCGSVVIVVTPGIICHVQCVVLKLHAQTANRYIRWFVWLLVFLSIICTTVYDALYPVSNVDLHVLLPISIS